MENTVELASQNDPLDRFYSHYNNFEPIAILSVDTPGNTPEQNQKNFATLTRHLFLAGFLYHRIHGEYTDRNRQIVEDTHTVIIYAYPDRQKELEKFALSLGKAFRQQAIMFIRKSGNTCLISPHNNSIEQTHGNFLSEYIQLYFNKVGKKKYKINTLSEPKDHPERPKTWEMPVFEAYRNALIQKEDIYTEWENHEIQSKIKGDQKEYLS